jgi:uncharacterized membrane protein YedE/YeeE
VPIGFLFGFALHKGGLCTASACSEVVLSGDGRKLWGILVAVVIAMLGFNVMFEAGWVWPAPMHFYWLNNIAGGLIFGVGMILAGGCVSGNLYKSAAGNVNSMAGLAGIPLGALAVQCGPLMGVRDAMMKNVIRAPGGAPLTLSSLTGLPFRTLSFIVALLTLAVLLTIYLRGRRRAAAKRAGLTSKTDGARLQRFLERPWKPWQAGLAIGLLGCAAYVSSAESGRHYPLGVASGVVQTELMLVRDDLTHVYTPESREAYDEVFAVDPHYRKVEWWEIALVFSLFGGAWVSGRLSRERLLPKPPEETIVAFFGGILVGVGAAVGFGCSIGHIFSGWALMSVGSFAFGGALILAAWAATGVYLVGWRRPRMRAPL